MDNNCLKKIISTINNHKTSGSIKDNNAYHLYIHICCHRLRPLLFYFNIIWYFEHFHYNCPCCISLNKIIFDLLL